MNQQINLYLPEFRRKKDPLSVDNMVLTTLGFLAILVVVTVIELWNSHQLREELEQRRQNLNMIVAETAQMEQEFGSQFEDPALAQRVDLLEEEVNNKRALRRFLTGRTIGGTDGFSDHLADLARYHLGGLRLTSVILRNGGNQMELQGEVQSPHLVPQYIQSLRQGQSFAGMEFETIRIDEAADREDGMQVKQFSVATAN